MKINCEELVDYSSVNINGDTAEVDAIIEFEEILFEISQSIIKYRKDNNLTQKQLAEILEVDQVMISKLERGNYNPTFKLLHKISKKLTGTLDFFIETLNNIVKNVSNMYETSYSVNSKDNEYFDDSEECKIFYCDFSKAKGGNYEYERCTSSISNVG